MIDHEVHFKAHSLLLSIFFLGMLQMRNLFDCRNNAEKTPAFLALWRLQNRWSKLPNSTPVPCRLNSFSHGFCRYKIIVYLRSVNPNK